MAITFKHKKKRCTQEPCPKGYTIKTAAAAATGAEYATEIQGRIPKRKEKQGRKLPFKFKFFSLRTVRTNF